MPQPPDMDETSRRLLETLDMWDDGVQLKREALRRRFPQATDNEVERELSCWLEGLEDLAPNHVALDWPRRPR